MLGKTTSWLELRSRLSSRTASQVDGCRQAGSRSQAAAPTMAARWTMTSASRSAWRISASSRTSPLTKSNAGFGAEVKEPLAGAVHQVVERRDPYPAASRCSQTMLPR